MEEEREKHQQVKSEREFLCVKDIVAMGLCSKAQAYNLFNTHSFPTIRVGSALRVRKSDFEKWLETQKRR